MKVLVACEFSGVVREAFRRQGCDAWSCDLLETEIPGQHIKGDVMEVLASDWDLMIAHPPCTYLAVSGSRWFKDRMNAQESALDFVRRLLEAPIARIALENPVSVISSRIRPPDQVIQPYDHGHGETKKTCLWLKGLPLLQPSVLSFGREDKIHKMAPSPERWKNRSRTYAGIAQAMAEQWS